MLLSPSKDAQLSPCELSHMQQIGASHLTTWQWLLQLRQTNGASRRPAWFPFAMIFAFHHMPSLEARPSARWPQANGMQFE